MRHGAKVWDTLETKPLRLKQRLTESGYSQGWLAREITKKGYKASRTLIWTVLNKQYQPTDFGKLKEYIEQILTESKIAAAGIWNELPGGECRMRQYRPQNSYKKRIGSNRRSRSNGLNGLNGSHGLNKKEEVEMNYTKSYLDDDVLRHFGLENDPFFDIMDFMDIWVSPRIKVVERRVYDTIRRHGIMAIVGDIGAGKTTFLRYVLTKMLKEKNIKIIYPDRMDRKELNGASLTQSVITQLGGQRIPRSAVERDALARKLLEENVRMGSNPVLILDEAHDLREEAYIALKRLWDSGMIFKLLSIILVGQGGFDSTNTPYELMDRLQNNPFIREFAERCYVIDMGSLNGSMAQYLDFRFKKIGGDIHKVFSDKSLAILSKRADVPQLANNIAIRAMANAFRDGKRLVEEGHILEA
ncbi:MAG TPA: ExeA family protein [Candidatus Wunengus sp. YC60]|uniref:ExeA family protein n=1 Tax=Candidatus Wunengus sp. YC60 TaxID=3367697 RepID=UPI00402567A7